MLETVELNRDCEAIAIPSGRRQTLPKGTTVRVVQSREGSDTVSTANYAMYRIDAQNRDALGFDGPMGGASEPHASKLSEQLVWDTLRTVYDPELPVNVVELGLIYSCTINHNERGRNTITVRMTMTSPGCGMSDVLKSDVEAKLMRLPEVSEARVEVVFDPPWNPNRMSESAKMQLGMEVGREQDLIQIARHK